MIAFDTNHLIRHLLQDDPKQCSQVRSLITVAEEANEPIYILDLVLLETCWVLQSVMGVNRAGWCNILDELLKDPVFAFEDASRLWETLDRYQKGKADFSDYLILSHAETAAAQLETFDKN